MARVLLVEDDPANISPLARLLRLDGHEVTVARSFMDGINLARHRDVLLVDLTFPGGAGVELIRHARAMGYRCRVAVLTAAALSTAEFTRDLGTDAVFPKPYVFADLLAWIEAAPRAE
jgi:DNA-binding response OmpR family regulator